MCVEWREVNGFEGRYEVSNTGVVRSLDRNEDSGKGHTRVRPGRVLSAVPLKTGHLRVCLYKDGKSFSHFVHRLVAGAFIPNPNDAPMVLHADDNPSNNEVSNLRWGNASDNGYDAVKNGLHPSRSRTHCPEGHEYNEENTDLRYGSHRVCIMCRKKQYHKRVAEGLAAGDGRHGTLTGYLGFACGCEPCKLAGADQRKRLRSKK